MDWTKPSQATSLLGVLLSTAATLRRIAQSYGKVGAVNQEATGTPPGGATRTLTVGTGIVVKERVRTSASGSTQIQFPDQSAINLGANCDLVIDQFVYDPQIRHHGGDRLEGRAALYRRPDQPQFRRHDPHTDGGLASAAAWSPWWCSFRRTSACRCVPPGWHRASGAGEISVEDR